MQEVLSHKKDKDRDNKSKSIEIHVWLVLKAQFIKSTGINLNMSWKTM